MPTPSLRRPRLDRLAIAIALLALGGCERELPEPTVTERAVPGPVFLLGFDGLDPRLVERWEREGLLPNFARLRREGAVGGVRSTVPMISPPAWTTVATGTPPSDHGIWSFWVPEGDDPRGRYVDATRRLAPAIWEDLTRRGRTVGIVNVPISCPPDSVNGFMIAGFPYPQGAPLTFPPSLEEEIVARGYRRDAFLGPPSPGSETAWLDRKLELARARREIGLGLLFDRRPEFSFIVFTTPDRIQHHLWRFHDSEHPHHPGDAPARLRNAVRDIYVWCDDILGEVLDRLDSDTTLLVLADHGFGPVYAGISKTAFLATLPPELRSAVASTRNLFGGDFYLGDVSDETRAAFRTALEEATDRAGSPLIRAVHDPSTVPHHGYGLEIGPDLIAEEAEGLLFAPGPGPAPGEIAGTLPPTSFSGYHRRLGYFGAFGRPVVPGPVRKINLRDVPALTMHLLGESIPRRYVHNIPRSIFPRTYFVERPMRFDGDSRDGLLRPEEAGSPATSPDETIIEQLRAVGYLD
jgi:hypothetical protein